MLPVLTREMGFYDIFDGLASHVVTAADELLALTREYALSAPQLPQIADEERRANRLTQLALNRLDRTFITPFDREDIYELVSTLESVVHHVNAIGKRLAAYHVKRIEPGFARQAELLQQAARSMSTAVKLLRTTHTLRALQAQIDDVHHQKSLGEDNHLAVLSKLFENGRDPVRVLSWIDLFSLVQAALGGCKDATNVIERVVLKNS